MWIKFLCDGKPAWGETGMERFDEDFVVPQAGWILVNDAMRFIVRQVECEIKHHESPYYSQYITLHLERLLDVPKQDEPCADH